MTITVEELRRKYPNSVAHPERNGGYCVGMAYLAEMTHQTNRAAFWDDCVNLPHEEAREIWEHIIEENDAGNFDVAWAWLDKALSA